MGFHAYAMDRLEGEHEHLVGRRVALLANARRRGFAVPSAFCVLKKTFHDFVRDTQLKLLLPALMNRLIAKTATMEQLSAEVRKAILETKIPPHILSDLHSSCETLGLGRRTAARAVTIRASPTDERLSSASLERAVAVIRVIDVENRVKQCWASVFDPGNLEAIRMHRMTFEEAAPSILISETIPAEVSGILFSQAPGAPGELMVEAVWGFLEALTEGKFRPSRYTAHRDRLGEARSDEAEQAWEYAQGPGGAIVRREIASDRASRPKLQRLQVEELLRASLELERVVDGPVAAEWSIQGGVIYFLQVVPLPAAVEARAEAAQAEAYMEAVRREERPAAARQAPASPAPPPKAPPPEVRPPPVHSAVSQPPSAGARRPRLLPVLRTSLYVQLPPGARADEAAHVPYAGLVVELDAWRQAGTARDALAEHVAAFAAAAFPRPVLLELADLDPPRYEAFQERGSRGGPVDARELPALLGAALEDLELVRAVAESLGATNLHLIAPFVKSAHDARLLRSAIESLGLGGAPGLRTLVFAEIRNPSTLLFNAAFAQAQDGVLVRANRFYKALLREGEAAPPVAPGGAQAHPDGAPLGSASFVQSLVRVTRGFENAGGTVLVLLEDAADLGTLWFYHELGVDGFVTRLKDAEACVHALADLERQPAAPQRRGKLR